MHHFYRQPVKNAVSADESIACRHLALKFINHNRMNYLDTETEGRGVTLREALASASQILQRSGNKSPTRDAELLLLHATRLSRIDLITQPERLLTADETNKYRELLNRRKRHEPIQYITGEREFYGLRFVVTPDVLIPRPETEHLVEAALDRIPPDAPFRLADVGTGSGAIAVALAVARPAAKIIAVDISPAALQIARQNASAHKVAERIQFIEANLLDGFAASSFDMIVSNPPYIASGERETLDAEVREFEPATALFAGPTGVEVYERLIPQVANALRPSGWLLLEIGAGQQLQLSQLLKGWSQISFIPDLQGIPRVALAQKP
jgi:release factor glutamine methyltransferase